MGLFKDTGPHGMLEDHSDFENQTFYPNLDKKLSDDRKKEIIEKVKEMMRT